MHTSPFTVHLKFSHQSIGGCSGTNTPAGTAGVSIPRGRADRSSGGLAVPNRLLWIALGAWHSEVMASLQAAGLSAETAEELLRTRWSEGGQKNLAAAWAQWKHHCDTVNASVPTGGALDILNPTPPQLVEFLRAVRKGVYRLGDKGDEVKK
jgi:hypothetical protein